MEFDKITPGIYKRNIGEPIQWTYEFSPNRIELYIVFKEGKDLIAKDIDGKNYTIEDPGFYDTRRNSVNEGSIDCFDLFKIEGTNCRRLKEDLHESKERASKLLQMLEVNKANLSEQNSELDNKNTEKLKNNDTFFWEGSII